MKLFYKSWGLAGAVLCLGLASSAFGQTTTLDFLGVNGSSPQLGNEDTSPYDFTVGTSSVVVQLICDSFNNHINAGQVWTATINDINNISSVGQFAGNPDPAELYDELGFLAIALLEGDTPTPNPTTPDGGANEQELLSWAIWNASSPGVDTALTSVDQQDVNNLDAWAKAAAHAYIAGGTPYSFGGIGLGNLVFYTPIPATGAGQPQEFIGLTSATPEPASAAVLGLDLFAFGGVVLFFRRRAPRAA
jgi:hypothetical protein